MHEKQQQNTLSMFRWFFYRLSQPIVLARVNQLAPTSAPMWMDGWMDGALIGFSFLSLCHPRFNFFLCPFSAFISVFFLQLYFLPAPHPVSFFFFF
jgi:hypothetical protein